jgi:hypothetical protein
MTGTRVMCYPYRVGGQPGRFPWLAFCVCGWHDVYRERHEAQAGAQGHYCLTAPAATP